jgi:thiol-disulfide isomerase/thioredoxin
MKKVGIALIAAATAIAIADTGANALQKTVGTINGAVALKASCTVQLVGGTPSVVSLELAKPGSARIETATRLVVADGTEITTYDKTAKTYYKQPETVQLVTKALTNAGVGVWNAFFDAGACNNASDVQVLPAVNRKGMNLTPVQFTTGGIQKATITYYLGSDQLPHQEAETVSTSKGDEVTVLTANTLAVGGTIDPSDFAFKAPDGSRQLTAEEMNADKWYTDYNEALAAAKASNRLVLIDFYTSWCHWCKVLRAEVYPTDKFKAMSKYYVFCEIDAEAQTSIASRYGVNAYPTSVLADADGNALHKIEGYEPVDQYVAEMESTRQAAGK